MGMVWEVLEVLAHRPRPEDSLPEALNLLTPVEKRRAFLQTRWPISA